MADRTPICFVAGCSNPCHPFGPRFARLLCEECRAAIPPGVQVAMAAQEAVIDALAEQTDVLLETLYQVSPKKLLKQRSRAENERIFLDQNFGHRLLVRAIAAGAPND